MSQGSSQRVLGSPSACFLWFPQRVARALSAFPYVPMGTCIKFTEVLAASFGGIHSTFPRDDREGISVVTAMKFCGHFQRVTSDLEPRSSLQVAMGMGSWNIRRKRVGLF